MRARTHPQNPWLCLPQLRAPGSRFASLHLRWVTSHEHTPGVSGERLRSPWALSAPGVQTYAPVHLPLRERSKATDAGSALKSLHHLRWKVCITSSDA